MLFPLECKWCEARNPSDGSECLYCGGPIKQNHRKESINTIRKAIPMNSTQLSDDEIIEKVIIIKIRQSTIDERENGNLYEATRKHWRVSLSGKAGSADYAMAVVGGIIKEVYLVKNWEKSDLVDGRYMFNGEIAPQTLRNKYIGKRIPSKFTRKGVASPILYTF